MTTTRTFQCNLCRTTITDGTGRGFFFGHKRVDWTTIQQAENHICDRCVGMLMCAFQDKGIVEQFGSAQS